jgi:hypothetical protein
MSETPRNTAGSRAFQTNNDLDPDRLGRDE